MATASFWDKLNVGLGLGAFGLALKSWGDILNLIELLRGGKNAFFGGKTPPPKSGENAAEKGSPEKVVEHLAQQGESVVLLTRLNSIRMAPPESNKRITEYDIPFLETHIFDAILASMPTQARELLSRTTGVGHTSVKRTRTTGTETIQVKGHPKEVPIVEVDSWTSNPDGERIIAGLTYLATHGTGKEEEQVARVVQMLTTMSIFNNPKDQATAALEKSGEALKQLRGWLTTNAHVVAAMLALGPKRLQDFLDTPECQRLLADIEAQPTPEAKNPSREQFKQLLVEASQRVTAIEKQAYAAFSKRNWKIVAGVVAIVTVTLLVLFNHFR